MPSALNGLVAMFRRIAGDFDSIDGKHMATDLTMGAAGGAHLCK